MHRLPDQINNSICHIKATIEAQLLQRPVEIFFDSSVIRDLHEAQPFSSILRLESLYPDYAGNKKGID